MQERLIADILAANFKGEKQQIRALGNWFYNKIRSSGGFDEIAVGSVKDELKRPRLVMYLVVSKASTPDQTCNFSISQPLTQLSLALRPNIFLDLYYCQPSADNKTLAETVLEDMKNRYGTDKHKPNPRLLYEEKFPKPSPAAQAGA